VYTIIARGNGYAGNEFGDNSSSVKPHLWNTDTVRQFLWVVEEIFISRVFCQITSPEISPRGATIELDDVFPIWRDVNLSPRSAIVAVKALTDKLCTKHHGVNPFKSCLTRGTLLQSYMAVNSEVKRRRDMY
jgi:hypothetical protein